MRTAEQVRYLNLAAQREGNRQLMAALSRMDLTPAQSEALRIIADHGPLALKELGSKRSGLRLASENTTQLSRSA